jgi:hypothetical protein
MVRSFDRLRITTNGRYANGFAIYLALTPNLSRTAVEGAYLAPRVRPTRSGVTPSATSAPATPTPSPAPEAAKILLVQPAHPPMRLHVQETAQHLVFLLQV